MVFRLPRRPKLGFKWRFGRWGNAVALIGLSALLASPAAAETIANGQSSPAVTVDNSVLERLGPPPVAKAPVKTASSPHQIIHLIPPTPASKTSDQKAAISPPTKPTVAALAAPVTAPKRPASNDALTRPVMPPQQAREEAPPASVAPPSEPAVAAAPPAAAPVPTIAARAATPAPMPAPSATATPPTTVATAAPVQMAAATTVGSTAMAVRFKPGVTELSGGAQPVLDAVANRLLANESLRVQLISHATGGADDAMEARRVSLARAVAVRAYLIDKGIRNLRIDVRALGNHADNGPVADQLDLLVVSQ